MSTADQAAPARPGFHPSLGPVAGWLRFFWSELTLTFRRPRNLALLAVIAAIPVLLGVVLKISAPGPGAGPPFVNQVTQNGVFLTLAALVVMLSVFLPLAVAVVSGDSVAGEAGSGTLRTLLTVPAGRTRLVLVKFSAVVVFCLAACLLVAVAALLTGFVLFPVGRVTLLSGSTIPLADGLLRVLLVVLYAAAGMAAIGAIGLALSCLTEHPLAAMAALMVIVIASEIADSVQQISAVHPYLPTHWLLSWDGLLRAPVDSAGIQHGLLSFAAYAVIFGSIAWARLGAADITS
jgi:ABC-type transport system involved in multi-copper enzyme maturation permease subunit